MREQTQAADVVAGFCRCGKHDASGCCLVGTYTSRCRARRSFWSLLLAGLVWYGTLDLTFDAGGSGGRLCCRGRVPSTTFGTTLPQSATETNADCRSFVLFSSCLPFRVEGSMRRLYAGCERAFWCRWIYMLLVAMSWLRRPGRRPHRPLFISSSHFASLLPSHQVSFSRRPPSSP